MRALLLAAVVSLTSIGLAWPSAADEPGDTILELAETPIGQHDFEKGSKDGEPVLPSYITPIEMPDNGPTAQRADWSPDSTRLIFLDAPMGDVWEYTFPAGDIPASVRKVTETGDVLRAHHLTNGDVVLCRSESGQSRFDGKLWVLPSPLGSVDPVALGEGCWEGIAVSKMPGSTRIAWNLSSIDFTKVPQVFVEAAIGRNEIWMGTVDYSSGTPTMANKELVVTKQDVAHDATVEAQDFRNDENELIFSAYAHQGGQVMGVTLDETRKVTDYSRSPWYEEPEGIDPQGGYVLVERDLSIMVYPGELDIWQLELDAEAEGGFRRLTTFNHYDGYGATNPVVAPNGSRFAFQMEKAGSEHGEGHGLFLFDLVAFNAQQDPPPPDYEPDPFRTPQRP